MSLPPVPAAPAPQTGRRRACRSRGCGDPLSPEHRYLAAPVVPAAGPPDWLKLAREEGRRSPKPRRGGARPVGGEAATLAALVAERNDATLAEYADRLAERAGVRRSPSALCRALKALGLGRKKRRSRPPSGIARTWPRRGPRGAPGWPGSTPPA